MRTRTPTLLRRAALTALGLIALGPVFGTPAIAESPSAPAGEAVVVAPALPLDALLSPLTDDRLFRDATVALQVVDVETGQEVYDWGADTALNPASTMKLVTAAAALKELGPSYRYTTELLRDGDVNEEGVLEGDLYVRGTGDPSLVLEKLWKLVYDLKLEGVNEISGDVIFDRSFMDDDYELPGWGKKEDIEHGPSYFPSLGALSLNFNTAALVVGPAEEVGGPARAVLETPAPGIIEIENELKTGARGSRSSIRLEREVEGSKMILKVRGSVPQGSDVRRYYRSVPDPTAYFTAAFASLMKQHDLKVRGHFIDGQTPDDADRVTQLRSPPLAVILMDTNKYSNNFMAEQVLKTLGAEEGGLPGTTEKGLTVVRDYLTSLGIPEDEPVLINGSGLSRQLFLRPSHITAVLVDMAHDTKVGHEFAASLAIGGRDGTLWSRFRDADQVGRLRGKTGTLDQVHCLAGYVEAADGRLYAFAFLVNDLPYSISRARRVHDRFANLMFGLDAEALAEGAP